MAIKFTWNQWWAYSLDLKCRVHKTHCESGCKIDWLKCSRHDNFPDENCWAASASSLGKIAILKQNSNFKFTLSSKRHLCYSVVTCKVTLLNLFNSIKHYWISPHATRQSCANRKNRCFISKTSDVYNRDSMTRSKEGGNIYCSSTHHQTYMLQLPRVSRVIWVDLS